MTLDRARALRGAFAGAIAAGAWAAQQPADKRVFGVDYDDAELLGKAVTRGPAWRPVGVAMHVGNGAAFGAVYATLAPRVPLPSWSRGPAAGLAEHLASWPFTAFIERLHPVGDEMPRLFGSRAAFAQATWRHLLFGVILGELERRLNPPEATPAAPVPPETLSTNGHGGHERAAAVTGAAVAAVRAVEEDERPSADDPPDV